MPASPLPDMPLEAEQIKEGNPVSRGMIAMQSEDKKMSTGFWECSKGTFEWIYTWDESVYILEGEVEVSEEGGKSYSLKPGDITHFPKGIKTLWCVIQPVKKMFVVRTSEPLE